MALLDEIAAFLAAEGIGTVGTDLFWAEMPATPDACGCVYASGGSSPDKALGSSGVRFEHPTIQVVFRGAPHDYSGPLAKAQAALDALVAVDVEQLLSGTKYNMITSLQPPFPMGGKDENKRWRIACNFMVEKEPS